MKVLTVYLQIVCNTPVDCRGLEKLCNLSLYNTVGSLLEKGAVISLLDYRAESYY
jgi:hypothetical protein